MPNADDGSAFVRFGTDAELLIYVSSQLLFLRAEHLDVGFMLSGFRRRHKVSQRPVCVLGRLPRRDVVCQRLQQERGRLVKSSQGLLFSEAKKPYAEAVGQTGAQGLVRGCGPHCPPVSRKNPARDEASGAPRAGRGSASFSGLISGVRVLSPALSGGRPGFRGG